MMIAPAARSPAGDSSEFDAPVRNTVDTRTADRWYMTLHSEELANTFLADDGLAYEVDPPAMPAGVYVLQPLPNQKFLLKMMKTLMK